MKTKKMVAVLCAGALFVTGMTAIPVQAATGKTINVVVGKTTKTTQKLSWNKVKGAKKYKIYKASGKKGKLKLVKTVSSKKKTYTVKHLRKGKTYSYKVKAVTKSGKTITTSSRIYAVTKGGKYTNPKSVSVSKTKFTITAGKTTKLKAKVKYSGRPISKKITYTSSNKSVATVSKKGTIKAKGIGTCTITAKAVNGKSASVKIIVEPTTAAHEHHWIKKTINYKEKGHYEKVQTGTKTVVDVPAHDEYEQYAIALKCKGCDFTTPDTSSESHKKIFQHAMEMGEKGISGHGAYTYVWDYITKHVPDQTHEEPVYENKWIVDTPAHTETVYYCTLCGATK